MIGLRIRELRKSKKLTQKKLAEKINVDCSAVTKWETGKANPDFEKQQFLADFFGVSVDYLLGRTDFMEKEKHTEPDVLKENMIVYCRNGQTTEVELSKEKMNLVLKMIDALTDEDTEL